MSVWPGAWLPVRQRGGYRLRSWPIPSPSRPHGLVGRVPLDELEGGVVQIVRVEVEDSVDEATQGVWAGGAAGAFAEEELFESLKAEAGPERGLGPR